MTDVLLLSMPFAEVQRPSIALGLLQASLAGTGVEVRSRYANLDFAARIDLGLYRSVAASPTDFLLGEWCFARAAFPDFVPDDAAFLHLTLEHGLAGFDGGETRLASVFRQLRRDAEAAIEVWAHQIADEAPRIVGCSSMFQQHCASLALLRRLKVLRPEIVTLLGGANCEGPMGRAAARAFHWVDLVVSGEADDFFAPLVTRLLEHGLDTEEAPWPYGVLSGATEEVGDVDRPPPRAIARDLDVLPVPDYDDYFAQLETSSLFAQIGPGLPIESSRGCWWGEKSHCSFCGLNGIGMGYRSKSGARVLEELEALASRYQLRSFEFVDNILDMAHLKSVLPSLVGRDYNVFYETKSNLKRSQLEILAAAGVRWIQPGVESLHDAALALIAKGNAAMMNLELLKHCRALGIRVSWNLLAGLPGECDDWYREMAEWLPAIRHLQPPATVARVRYDRFSPYHLYPDRYGLSLVPTRTYAHVYPLPPSQLADLAYFFEDRNRDVGIHRWAQVGEGGRAVQASVGAWNQAWFGHDAPPTLTMIDHGDRIVLYDDRPEANIRRYTVTGLAMAIYHLCDQSRTPASLLRALEKKHPATFAPEAVDETVEALCRRRLMIRIGGRLLSLAIHADSPALPDDRAFPGGYTAVTPPIEPLERAS